MAAQPLHPLSLVSFYYVIVHEVPSSTSTSLCQGFNAEFAGTAELVAHAATLPCSAMDFTWSRTELVTSRVKGIGGEVIPVQLDALDFLLQTLPFELVVVLCPPSIRIAVRSILDAANRPSHLLSDIPPQRAPKNDLFDTFANPWGHTISARATHFAELAHFASTRGIDVSRFPPDHVARPDALPIQAHTHGVTTPTELALVALGRIFPTGRLLKPSDSTQSFATQQAFSIRALLDERRTAVAQNAEAHWRRTPDLLLTVPSMYAHLYRRKHRRFAGAPPDVTLALDLLATQSGYTFQFDPGAKRSPRSMEELGRLLAVIAELRSSDLAIYTALLSVHSAFGATPVLRLPAGINRFRGPAAQLAGHVRAGNATPESQSRLAQALSASMAEALPLESNRLIADVSCERVAMFADAPLEWLPASGYPLMLSKDCHRLPVTPGNMFAANALLGGHTLYLGLESFEEVLVVRSFEKGDPVSEYLSTALKTISPMSTRLRVCDVSTPDEFCDAVNTFTGSVMVFDGHGGAGSLLSPGTLRVGASNVDPWELRSQIQLPPIVLLSACDTAAYDTSHGTPARAMLAAGATTVLGTSLPVSADYAAILVARFLLRIEMFLPALLGNPSGSVRWSQVFPGLQRMNYASESLRILTSNKTVRLSDEAAKRVLLDANTAINSGEALGLGWLDRFVRSLSAASGLSESALDVLLKKYCYITEALKYVQLGNPHCIVIERSDVRSAHAERVRHSWRQ